MKKIINENEILNILGFDPKSLSVVGQNESDEHVEAYDHINDVFEQNESDEQLKGYEHINDNKFFIDYSGVTMKNILESRGLDDCWSYCNTDTHEIVEAPDNNWLSNIIFELYEIQGFDKKFIISLLEEYFIERKKGIIGEWEQLAARYLDLFPEEYENLKNMKI